MANSVFLNRDGFIEQKYIGDQTYDSVQASVRAILELSKQLRKNGKPVKILTDLSRLGNPPPAPEKHQFTPYGTPITTWSPCLGQTCL
ncbi:hypothetical protein EPN90_03905 [Patescibacteria group bacterium]|nr:MAG: hypothetical protein EPN90_03905 [Patescibacteria group bacterium]